MMKKYTFKPLGQIHAYVLVIFVLIMPPFGVILLFPPYDRQLLIAAAVMYGVEILTFLCVRLFYSVKYVVDDIYIVKYRGNKIAFKIKKADIKKVYIKKSRWFSFFGFVYDLICGHFIKTHGTCISFVFARCETIKKENYEIPRMSLKQDEDKELFEVCEILSSKKCLTLCKKLSITPIFV